MKKILITGASGFIGSFLIDEALKQGYKVYAGVRETSKLTYLQDSRIQLFKTNLADKEAIKTSLNKFGKFDFIIHNAGITKSCRKGDFDKINYQYTRNLIEALYESNTIPQKFVQISSLAAYGSGDKKTLKPINVTDIPNPVSYYGKSKLKTEQYIGLLKEFPYLIFRPTGVYGPREKDYYLMYKSIKKGIETYVGTSEQHISFIYVKDLAHLIINALNYNIVGKSYFVSDLKNYTTKEFNQIVKNELNVKTIKIVFPKPIIKIIAFLSEYISCFLSKNSPTLNTEKYKEISQKNWLCDSSSLVSDFDFKPEYDLKKGINETIQWYKKEKLL